MPKRFSLADGWSIALEGDAEREDGREDGVTIVWNFELSIEFQRAEGEVATSAHHRGEPLAGLSASALALNADGVCGSARLDSHSESDGTFSAALNGVAVCDGQSVFVRICFELEASSDRAIAAWQSLRKSQSVV
ncbi:MAG: hypothetical protein Q8S33_38020 [Myxococcales bacterium]|nr:hypothetical protein [Myxococcales bacterium]MDP3506199.1 hypothetical protein [Myxococcales bacterium]